MHSKRSKGLASLALAFLVVAAIGSPVNAQTVDVAIQGFAFDPASLSITAGTTVRWTNMDSAPHTSTSDAPLWDSGTLNQGEDFSFTFNEEGEYPYHCEFHGGMTATISVAPAVPGLGGWGLILLVLGIVGITIVVIRRKRVLA